MYLQALKILHSRAVLSRAIRKLSASDLLGSAGSTEVYQVLPQGSGNGCQMSWYDLSYLLKHLCPWILAGLPLVVEGVCMACILLVLEDASEPICHRRCAAHTDVHFIVVSWFCCCTPLQLYVMSLQSRQRMWIAGITIGWTELCSVNPQDYELIG